MNKPLLKVGPVSIGIGTGKGALPGGNGSHSFTEVAAGYKQGGKVKAYAGLGYSDHHLYFRTGGSDPNKDRFHLL